MINEVAVGMNSMLAILAELKPTATPGTTGSAQGARDTACTAPGMGRGQSSLHAP